jgi:glycerol kinase
MAMNDWFLQFLADILGIPVERPQNIESTVLGAAYLVALQSGVINSTAELSRLWRSDVVFEPSMPAARRDALIEGWHLAVARVRSD